MVSTIPVFNNSRVLVVGDIMLDRYWHGAASRISPEAPVPVVHVNKVQERPGGAGNVALNIRALDGQAAIVGITGEDEAADHLQNKLAAAGVENTLLRNPKMPTVTKLRVISLNQQLLRLDFEEQQQRLDITAALEKFQQHLSQSQVVVLSDYGKGMLADAQAFIHLAKAAGLPILVDKGQQALIANEITALLVTRGEQGMTLLRQDAPALHLPARAREVFDVTGAGDTVIAVLAASLAAGESLENATNLANIAAGIVVGKLGAASVALPELRRALQKLQGTSTGVLSEEQLLVAVNDARAHGERIIMTNGCFDILHAGHIAYLEKAKALGARLIVAVNDDHSVKRLKGPARPINVLSRRMAVLAALEAVDWVVPFTEDTPARLIEAVLPDVLAKGGDYTVEQIAGGQAVLANGGEVKILEFESGCSTTAIVETILEGA